MITLPRLALPACLLLAFVTGCDDDPDDADGDGGRTPFGDGGPDAPDANDEADASPGDAEPAPDAAPGQLACVGWDGRWERQWIEFEDEVLRLTNEARAAGADCRTQGSFGPAGPLAAEDRLRCTARMHSLDMAERGFFDHTDPDGGTPSTRARRQGYRGSLIGENIAVGQRSPAQVVNGWMNSDGHCANIMNPSYTLLGAGFVYHPRSNSGYYWTQVFGR